ncbi:HlyD family efflux transporter periplasmic adaptor subunit [Rarobacter faecitabidus]|uniref:Macrolide-specific efflux system membrane fusion protein n=1 Tax=Rarobacter faecitabidus TaxID=13243 RepID=A0A542ZTG2_RARFA|nr:biotin/lipoyl-binding protein [Rarobacter faecitabidus]TQL63643.1 macrolide-specific efflux system membrane fusion protein [Rarobacter faecitabidus]
MAQRTRKRLRRPSWRVLIIVTAFVLIAGGGTAFAITRGNQPESAEPAATTATASLATIERTVSASGTLTPTATADEAFDASGTVEAVYVAEGDTVTEGQKLAKIDDLSLTKALLEAKVSYLSAKADYDEATSDADGSDLSDVRLSAAKAALKVAKQSYRDAKEAMSDQTLRASIAGLVTSVGIEVGDVTSGTSSASSAGGETAGASAAGNSGMGATTTTAATTSSAAVTIVGTATWQVSTTVAASDIDNVSAGLQVEMTSDDLTDTVYGIVSAVGKLPDTSSGTIVYPVTIDVTGDTSALFDGVSVDVSIIYERRTNVLTVPSAAVTTTDGAATVELVGTDGTVTTTTVEVGQTSGDQTEITSGISEGDTVQYQPFQAMGGSGSGDSERNSQMPEFGDFGVGGQGGPPSGGAPGGFPGGGQ